MIVICFKVSLLETPSQRFWIFFFFILLRQLFRRRRSAVVKVFSQRSFKACARRLDRRIKNKNRIFAFFFSRETFQPKPTACTSF